MKKYKEIISYAFFGVLTTAVNFFCFYLLNKALGSKLYLISNVIAWIVAVAFAYITNKLWVFSSKSWKAGIVLKEATEFVLARLFSLGIEEAGLFILVDLLYFKDKIYLGISGEMIAKIILAIIVVILNYIFSKFVVFKKKAE